MLGELLCVVRSPSQAIFGAQRLFWALTLHKQVFATSLCRRSYGPTVTVIMFDCTVMEGFSGSFFLSCIVYFPGSLISYNLEASNSHVSVSPSPTVPETRFPVRSWGETRLRSRLATCPISRDRKSTRLNSSHGYISYAVF